MVYTVLIILAFTLGHVQFTEDVLFDPHAVNCISKSKEHGVVDIGILQVLHNYIVSFDMKHSLGAEVEMPQLQTPAVSVIALRKLESSDGHHVVLEVDCGETEHFSEKITFENSSYQTFTIQILAKLMPNHLGTPSLKSGVKILHKRIDNGSDTDSDWQGFVDI